MDIRPKQVFGAGFMLATLLASFAAFSQDDVTIDSADRMAEIDALEPGFDTAAASTAAEASDTAAIESSGTTSSEPAAVLAQNSARTGNNPAAMDSIELAATEITGNQELPTVMVIVPWQKAEPGDLVGKPVNTLLDEVLAPIDREEFVRRVNYYGDVYGEDEQ